MVMRRRARLETLLAVDEQIGAIIGALEQSGRLANTLVIFVSDNGLAQWEHRWTYKIAPYVESARIPLLMRWDAGIPADVKRGRLAANIDIPATILEAAGIPDSTLDGKSLLPVAVSNTVVRTGLLLEHVKFRDGDPETFCGWQTPRYLYVRDATGFEELYDQQSDPWQLVNLAPSKVAPLGGLRTKTRAACAPLPPGMPAF
jgi:arylsulfatase A-like enzyme